MVLPQYITLILATIQSKNQKWFKTTKQTSKYVTSNVYYRIFMMMSQISRFPHLFKKALKSETLFLAQLKNRLILYQ